MSDTMNDDDMDMMDMPDDDIDAPVFWSMKVTATAQEIQPPSIPDFIIHVTNACFGPAVKKNSRSVVVAQSTDDEGKESEVPLCVLMQGKQENQSLDLLFDQLVSFQVKGQNVSPVTLTGYLQPPATAGAAGPGTDDMEMNEAMMEQMMRQQEMAGEMGDADEDDEEPPQVMDDEDEPPKKKMKTSSGPMAAANGQKKKKKTPEKPKQQKKKTPEKPAEETPKQAPKSTESKKSSSKKKKKKKMQKMKGGIEYRDMKLGDGKPVKKGSTVKVYYVGQKEDKSVFDRTISGDGFAFQFGAGEVIKGWDMGLEGMRVGGKRKLVIPPKLAYGKQGNEPDIPPNATLTFTVEIKAVE